MICTFNWGKSATKGERCKLKTTSRFDCSYTSHGFPTINACMHACDELVAIFIAAANIAGETSSEASNVCKNMEGSDITRILVRNIPACVPQKTMLKQTARKPRICRVLQQQVTAANPAVYTNNTHSGPPFPPCPLLFFGGGVFAEQVATPVLHAERFQRTRSILPGVIIPG